MLIGISRPRSEMNRAVPDRCVHLSSFSTSRKPANVADLSPFCRASRTVDLAAFSDAFQECPTVGGCPGVAMVYVLRFMGWDGLNGDFEKDRFDLRTSFPECPGWDDFPMAGKML